jgi:hypothetical protein
MKAPKELREYLAKIGAKGGKADGERKARDPEHYARLAKLNRERFAAARKAKKKKTKTP